LRCRPVTASACTRSRTWCTSRSAAASTALWWTAPHCCRTSRAVEHARGDVSLTYFEFTLLAIARLLAETPLDLVILEVGMGGRLDAVNAFDADCAIITSIDIDHAEYLGPDRETIAIEKAGIMRAGKPAIVSDPVPPQSLIAEAARVGADLWRLGRDFNCTGDKQQWRWAGRTQRFNALAYPALRGANQLLNAAGVLAAFEAMRGQLPITAQAVRQGFATVELAGRFQIVAGQPTLVLDVAHNPHAVATLRRPRPDGLLPAHACGVRGDGRQGHRGDPDAHGAFCRSLALHRLADAARRACRRPGGDARGSGTRRPRAGDGAASRSPMQALDAALNAADPADRIVVFGSFHTVGGVLRDGVPRLTGKHAG
jgi:dihydrofolate synthase/folylpolyglutamate synthase